MAVEIQNLTNFHGIFTSDPQMKKLFELVSRVAKTDSSVLFRGDTGTGKELFASAVHVLSPRRQAPFKALNCASLSGELMHSELFGHVKGAFTGAVSDHSGLFHAAQGGTMFLDELAEIPLDLQAKLLRVFQDKTFQKVGSTRMESVDVRFVSATHASLRKMVENGHFREDLMYRIRVVPVFIPGLADRGRDPEFLTQLFIQEFNQEGFRTIQKVSKKAADAIMNYSWPGNVRELRNNIEHAFAVGEGPVLNLEDLTPELQGRSYAQDLDYEKVEKKKLLKALTESNGHRGKASEKLGMSRATFWRKCKYYQII